jgi:hypothetical protein
LKDGVVRKGGLFFFGDDSVVRKGGLVDVKAGRMFVGVFCEVAACDRR